MAPVYPAAEHYASQCLTRVIVLHGGTSNGEPLVMEHGLLNFKFITEAVSQQKFKGAVEATKQFYEDSQNSTLDRRANQHFQKQVWDVKISHPPSKGAREVDIVPRLATNFVLKKVAVLREHTAAVDAGDALKTEACI